MISFEQRFIRIPLLLLLLLFSVFTLCSTPLSAAEQPFACAPTVEDEMGPFYKPGAPYRHSVGKGYLLFGTVKSAVDCRPIPAATVELWMTGPEGKYGDEWWATLFSAKNGTYYFTSNAATEFGNRRPHIHMRVTAEGFKPLVTQHYPVKGAGEGQFDLVLTPLTVLE
jgi:protocatechuate 3,4-dioxygenase beta subunit